MPSYILGLYMGENAAGEQKNTVLNILMIPE
jgi:hypothetical protein